MVMALLYRLYSGRSLHVQRLLPPLLLLCMAVAVQHVTAAPSIMEEAYITKVPLQRPSEAEIFALQYQIGYTFKSQAPLMDALTHASYSEHNNEALNVLGVKVLQQSIALHFFLANPDITKGELEINVAKLVMVDSCAQEARILKLDKLVMVSKAIDKQNKNILAAAYHALFGAIAIDSTDLNTVTHVCWKRYNWNHTQSW